MKEEGMVVLCTFPSEEKARQIGALLVEKQVAACVNLIPKVTSIYRWEGAVQEGLEVLAVIKTTATAYPELERSLGSLHPYEVPEVLALPVKQGSPAYLNWLVDQVRPVDESPG
ncbi:MAG: divalent-cation tolerance protein CutA [Verrucomicrobiales bacterium]